MTNRDSVKFTLLIPTSMEKDAFYHREELKKTLFSKFKYLAIRENEITVSCPEGEKDFYEWVMTIPLAHSDTVQFELESWAVDHAVVHKTECILLEQEYVTKYFIR